MTKDSSNAKHMRTAVIVGVGLIIAIPLIWHGCNGGFDDDFEDPDFAGDGYNDAGQDGAGETGDAGQDESDPENNMPGLNVEEREDGAVTDIDPNIDPNNPTDTQATCVTLLAGQNIDVGKVCVSVDRGVSTTGKCEADESRGVVNVAYLTKDGWTLSETHLAAGDEFRDIPLNKAGNPKVGQFPYHGEQLDGATRYVSQVPLCEFGIDATNDTCDPVAAFLAAHAVVHKDGEGEGEGQTETAWADGDRIVEKGSWATYFTVLLECGVTEPPAIEQCESAFAESKEKATCFIGGDFDGDGHEDGVATWGWSNGPIAPGVQQNWPVFATVGGCEAGSGTMVGTLDVNYGEDGTIKLHFEAIDDFAVRGEHIYVGERPLMKDPAGGFYTVAPGRYANIFEGLPNQTTTDHELSDMSGELYVVYHAVTCGTFD